MADPAIYDNDEIMAKLGRDVIDQLIGLRKKGIDNPGPYLVDTIDAYLSEDDAVSADDPDEL